MISINKPEIVPDKLRDIQISITEELFKKRERFKWETQHYSVPIKEELKTLYSNKCAFCEVKLTDFDADNKFTVEHFRPKEFYYWLAYEWSNLLPTCPKCNRLKNDEFPIINDEKRIKSHPEFNGKLDKTKCKITASELVDEEAYIINPEIDNPDLFLDFKIENNKKGIEIYGIDVKNRGEKTIDVCNLNRVDLLKDRQEFVIDSIIELIDFSFSAKEKALELLNIAFENIEKKAKDIRLVHTLFRKTILNIEKFEEIICPYIENTNQREIVLEAFKKYKKSSKP